jgi:tetratricopeptide (TPR) repeat protein
MPARSCHFVIASLLLTTFPTIVQAQQPGSQQQQQSFPERPSSVVVSVRQPDGSPLERPAVVNLYAFSGAAAAIGVYRSGTAEFTNLSPGNYTLEIISAGFEKLTEPVSILASGERLHLTVELKPEGSSTPSSALGPPVLAPNAQKEMTRALDSLRDNKLEDAKHHLEKAEKAAPAHPDVNYVWGLYYASANDFVNAKISWEKAIQLSSKHAFSLAGLAQIASQTGDYTAAIDYLKRACEAAPSSWRFHEKLAEAYLHQQQFGEAQKQALRALEQGKERAADAHFVLAQILMHNNDREAARMALDAFLASQPSGPSASEARRMYDALREPQPVPSAEASFPVVSNKPAESARLHASPPTAAALPAASITATLMPAPKWMPPDVDDSMPPVETVAACPLEELRERAGKRVSEFVDAVNRIAATESLENEVIDHSGLPIRREARHYSYVASVQQVRPGTYTMEEYRNGMMDLDLFPERIATLGLTALVMVFHPTYQEDYDLTCEGLSRWHDGLAWQLHFRQKADKPARLRSYRVNARSYPIALRGRAWISAENFQILTLETDLVRPVPQIQLRAEHISVEYAPVQFISHRQKLWLPERAEIYFDYGNRRMHRSHHFRNYMLFAVDEKQQISSPTVEAEVNGASGPQPK